MALLRRYAPRPVTLRELNRSFLARQMLFEREKLAPRRAIERLIGLQAQLPRPPFIGLWSRLTPFRRADLSRLLHDRSVVRATSMRGTLHLMAAGDYAQLRACLQPMLRVLGARARGLDVDALVAAARASFGEKPRTFEDVRDVLVRKYPRGDARAMGYAVRLHLPLVQVPGDGAWGYPPSTDFALAEEWLGRKLASDDKPHPLVLRMVVDERGRELYDLPDAPQAPGDAVAPVRFLPEWDGAVMGHADRTRIVAEKHRPAVYRPNLLVPATFLVDGFVAGTWKIERKRKTAALAIQPFGTVPKPARKQLEAEGERLVRFVEEDAETFEVRFK